MPRGMRFRFLALLGLLPLLLQISNPARAVEVTWLYEALVPVADQSAGARLDAAREGLLQVLTRVTGLPSVPRSEALEGALAAPDLYFNQFVFERAEPSPDPDAAGGEQGGSREQGELLLRLQFVPSAVLRLVREAGLPVWRSERPSVIAWLAEDDGQGRHILASGVEHPVVRALEDRAWERGVPLQLPLMDLDDQLQVEPGAVWGRLSQSLVAASERYAADIILIGRLRIEGEDRWAGSWEFWVDGEVRALDQAGEPPEVVGGAAIDLLADELVQRYAVFDRGVRELRLGVSAVRGPTDYAQLMGYLSGLEFVDDVRVVSARGDRLDLALRTTADAERLLAMFRVDGLLFPDQLSSPVGGGLDLVWRQR